MSNGAQGMVDDARYHALFQQAAVGIKQVALDGRLLDVNEKLCRILGYERSALLSRSFAELTHADDLPAEQALIARLRSGEIASYTLEKRHLRQDGSLVWVRVAASLVHTVAAEPYYVAIVEDISDRIAAERELVEREARLRTIFETAPDAIVVIDEAGLIQAFSNAAQTLFGYAPEDIIGRDVSLLMPAPERHEHGAHLARYLETGVQRIIGIGRVVVGQRRDGSVFPMELAVGEVPLATRRLFAGFIRDLTERLATEKRLHDLQAELLHASRVSAMGQLAAALAHEVNQPLAAIGNYLQAARRMITAGGTTGDPRIADAIDKAAAQTARAGKVIQSMRSFIRKEDGASRPEDLNTTVEEACTLAMAGIVDVGITLDLAPDLPPVLIDKVPVQQVVVNLMRNAIEAMAGAERRLLTIRTSFLPTDRMMVEIGDTGPGLPAEIAERLFQPFVTTKAAGMGLGLSICRTIVNSHGGSIKATANPGGGTIFAFDLPAAPVAGMTT